MKNWQKSCNFAYKDQNSIDTDTIFTNFAQHFSTFTFWYAALNEILKYNALRNHFELQFIFFVHVNFIDGVRFFSGRLLVTLSLWLVLMHFSWQLKKIVVIFFCVVIPLKQQQRKNCLFCIADKMLEKSTWTWILYVVCVLFHLIFFLSALFSLQSLGCLGLFVVRYQIDFFCAACVCECIRGWTYAMVATNMNAVIALGFWFLIHKLSLLIDAEMAIVITKPDIHDGESREKKITAIVCSVCAFARECSIFRFIIYTFWCCCLQFTWPLLNTFSPLISFGESKINTHT